MSVIGFAHRGAPAAGMRENTLAAFTDALAKAPERWNPTSGSRATACRCWSTTAWCAAGCADDRSAPCGHTRSALDAPLDALYATTGGDFELCLDMKDPAAAARWSRSPSGTAAAGQLWLCGSAGQVRNWRPLADEARLVVSTTLRTGGASRRMDEARIDEAAKSARRR